LAASIGMHGVLQPILVRPHPASGARFQIVAGERRYQAARQAGLNEIPAIVREMTDAEALELALVENVLREDITPLEEARTLKRLIDTLGYSYAKLGERLGKNKAYVDHRVRLLKMPDEIQQALDTLVVGEDGKPRRPFSPRHAGIVSQLDDADLREALIARVLSEGLSVVETQRRKGLLHAIAEAAPAEGTRARLEHAALSGVSDAELARRLETRPAVHAPIDGQVALDVLETWRLLAAAQLSGEVAIPALLEAMARDRRSLRANVAES
ncbi:MAG TPA: ParB/RepB/Spo0J family partition protein, partial [Oscillatoriaceae cyanobacterium]